MAFITAVSVAPTALLAQDHDDHHNDRVYHDKAHNDDHHWDSHEDKAYRMWTEQNHRQYRDFSRLKEHDQQAYWGWRHDHPDAVLNINIP
jgi:hypothetical protein